MKHKKQGSIGVFDSGFGGINILKGIVRRIPQYHYIYLGDSARAPYGTRSQESIYTCTQEAIDALFEQGCELIILACNTASSEALRKIQQEYLPLKHPGKKVLGVLIPAAEEAIKYTKNNRIGVMATEGTVASHAFVREIKKLRPQVKVYQQACPLLVSIVEAGELKNPALPTIIEEYLKPLKKRGIDTLILGCTHYGILEKAIKKTAGNNITVLSEAKIIPKKVADYLVRHPEIEKNLTKTGGVTFYSTDLTKKFTKLGSKFFGKPIQVTKITLEKNI